jgi:hypothetical protein
MPRVRSPLLVFAAPARASLFANPIFTRRARLRAERFQGLSRVVAVKNQPPSIAVSEQGSY